MALPCIPLFMEKVLCESIAIYKLDDGEQTRDFTFVGNAVQANIKGLFTTNPKHLRSKLHVACEF